MKTKEAIRKDIIHYANLTWDDFNVNNLNPLVRLMIEVVSQELYLLDHRIEDIKYSVLERLIKILSPSGFHFIRPSHAVIKLDPTCPVYHLDKNTLFVLKELPARVKKKEITTVSYTPVTDTSIYDIRISHLFFDKTLWHMDAKGKKKIVGTANRRAKYNTLWLGLEIGQGVENLAGVPVYFDFPHLPDHHIYYELLSEQIWEAGDKILDVEPGYPVPSGTSFCYTETEILDLYKNHFLTINEDLPLSVLRQGLPQELYHILDAETAAAVPSLYWIAVSFPQNINHEDVAKVSVSLNAFPVINREFKKNTVEQKDIAYTTSLSSGIAEEFLDIDLISDSQGNTYRSVAELSHPGDYTIDAVQRKNVEDPRIIDYLERLLDIIHDERTAFPGINKDKIAKVLNSVSAIQERDTQKITINHLLEYAEVGLVNLMPYEGISEVDITYWTTHADLLNGIARGTELMASKIPELNKSAAVFLTDTAGGRNFYGRDSLVAINRFYMTSKGRVLSKNDILNYCRIELGNSIEKIDVKRKAVVSIRRHEGIIIVMEIQIKPSANMSERINQKGELQELLVRLRRKSPDNFDYRIKIIE